MPVLIHADPNPYSLCLDNDGQIFIDPVFFLNTIHYSLDVELSD